MSVISFITVSHIKDYISSTCHTLVLCLPVLQRCIKIYLLRWSFDTDADSCCWWWQFTQQQLHTFYTEWRIKCRGLQYLLCSIHITEPLAYATFYCILDNFVMLNNNDRSHHIDHYWCQPLLYSTIFVSPCIVQYWSHPVKWNIGVTKWGAILVSPCIAQYWCHPVLYIICATLYTNWAIVVTTTADLLIHNEAKLEPATRHYNKLLFMDICSWGRLCLRWFIGK